MAENHTLRNPSLWQEERPTKVTSLMLCRPRGPISHAKNGRPLRGYARIAAAAAGAWLYGPPEHASDLGFQRFAREWLDDISSGAGKRRLRNERGIVDRRCHDEWKVVQLRVGADFSEQGQAVHSRHAKVRDHEMIMATAQRAQRVVSVMDSKYVGETHPDKHATDQLHHCGIVVHHQNGKATGRQQCVSIGG
jgi:hypothetical protein